MYPRNAASPPRIAVGAIYVIATGAKVVADASVVVRAEGGNEGAGDGTLAVGATSGIWYYTPTQAETNYTAFTVTVYKADCTTATVTIVTTATAVSGTTSVGAIAANAIDATAIKDDAITAAKIATDAITDDTIATGAIASTAFAAGAITNAAVADDVDVNVKTISTDAITAAAVKADAVTKIQAGLSTMVATDIVTGGAITTASGAVGVVRALTNPVNLPTGTGDAQIAHYPAYSGASNASAWKYGVAVSTAPGGVYDTGFSGTDNKWMCHTIPLTLNPGVYYLTGTFVFAGFTLDADIGDARFSIFEDDGGTLTPITFGNGATYIDMTADIEHLAASGAKIGPTTVASVSFTLESGKSYQMGWGIEGKAGRTAAHPGIVRFNDTKGPQNLTCYSTYTLTSFPPASHTGAANSSGELPRGYITFTTSARKLLSTTYSTAKDVLIPKRTDGDYCVKLQDSVVADGQSLSCAVMVTSSGNDATQTTLALDMGATDQVTFGAANVSLAAAGAEAGDTFDLLYEQRADNKADVFYVNKTSGQGGQGDSDIATISHACKNASARAAEYSVTSGDWLRLSGTATVSALEVGWQPLVILGDSQCSRTSSRLGTHLPTAFTHDRIWWQAWIAGNALCNTSVGGSTAGYLRYKSASAGYGDLCEMTTPLFVYGGMGLNDISGLVNDLEANRNGAVSLITTRLAEIIDDLQDRSVPSLIIGLPPYSSGTASAADAAAIRDQLNGVLEGAATASRCAFVNPWYEVVEAGTELESIPTFDATYTEDGGTHYNSAGAQLVAILAAAAVELGYTASRWPNSEGELQDVVRAAVGLAEANLDTQIGDVNTYVDCLPATWVIPPAASDWTPTRAGYLDVAISSRGTGTSTLDAAGVRTAVGMAAANLDTQLSTVAAKTGLIPASPAAVGSAMTLTSAYDAAKTAAPTVAQIRTELFTKSVTNDQAAAEEDSLITLILAGFHSRVADDVWTIYRTDNITTHATKPVTSDGAADPITGVS